MLKIRIKINEETMVVEIILRINFNPFLLYLVIIQKNSSINERIEILWRIPKDLPTPRPWNFYLINLP